MPAKHLLMNKVSVWAGGGGARPPLSLFWRTARRRFESRVPLRARQWGGTLKWGWDLSRFTAQRPSASFYFLLALGCETHGFSFAAAKHRLSPLQKCHHQCAKTFRSLVRRTCAKSSNINGTKASNINGTKAETLQCPGANWTCIESTEDSHLILLIGKNWKPIVFCCP